VASPSQQAWFSNLVHDAQSLIQLPSAQENLYEIVTSHSTSSFFITTTVALLLSLIFLLYRHLMTHRSSWGGYGGPGPHSPYPSSQPTFLDSTGRTFSDHIQYISPDDDWLQRDHPAPGPTRSDSQPTFEEDPEAPDVVHVRYMADLLRVEFSPFAINEEKATVAKLREHIAKALDADPRRVRLVYKQRELKHDRWPLRKYHMKQNSEVTAILTEGLGDYSGPESHSDSGEESGSAVSSAVNNPSRRPRGNSSVRYRSDDHPPAKGGGAFLHPNGYVPAADRDKRNSLRPERDDRGQRSEPLSRSRSPSPNPAFFRAQTPAADPNSPLGKLQSLSSTFRNEWLPKCQAFIHHPPVDDQARARQHLKLSESVMMHITLKADDIRVDNPETRAFRKNLIDEVAAVMHQLDEAKNSR